MSDPSAAWSGANRSRIRAPAVGLQLMVYLLVVVHVVVTIAALVGASVAAKA